ncbi:MAG: Spo0E family sporulation regulatory protein-aspartic acid phosphatase [Clostridiales bacterium]|jgi:hypothetical protein|nr:Spo0E family sporulation regulatory protein-aspartic acid phosphatase [Clostridiales bacterium]
MEGDHLIHEIKTKQEELNNILLLTCFNFSDQKVQQLNKELDNLILQYLQCMMDKKTDI